MGCLVSKNDNHNSNSMFERRRKRSQSLDSSSYSNRPRFNDNKLLQLKHLSGSLRMEAELLEDLNKRMPRYSTAANDLSMDGFEFYNEDGTNYTKFKMDLVNYTPLRLQFVSGIPEAISGQTTPAGFPGYTKNIPKKIPIYATVNKNMKRNRRNMLNHLKMEEEQAAQRRVLCTEVRIVELPQVHRVKIQPFIRR